MTSPRPGGGRHFPRDHHLGRFDDRDGVLSALQLQLVDRIPRDDGSQALIADSKANLRQQAVDAHFFDKPMQPVASAEGDDPGLRCGGAAGRGPARMLVREEALDLGLRDAVMPARGVRRAHHALMNPLLERRVADAEADRLLRVR